MPDGKRIGDHAPEYKHVDEMEWEMGRLKTGRSFSFIRVQIVRPSQTPVSYDTNRGRVILSTDTTSRRCGTS